MPSGNVTLAPPRQRRGVHVRARSIAVVSAGRDGDTFEPRHTTHGFQYVQIDGHPHRLTPDDVIGVVVHTDLRRTGWFRCSDERVNRFHEIADWSFRENACDVPTDCPDRERAGWTGDWQVFLPSAAFLYDVAGFSRKWLRDLAVEQRADGCVLNIAPGPGAAQGLSGPDDFWPHIQGSAGWGDAVVMVPWELYRVYGDRDVLDELWPAMVRWVDYAGHAARTKRHPDRAEARPRPGAARGVPVGRRLPLGRVDRAGWHRRALLGDRPGPRRRPRSCTTAPRLLARIGRLLGHDDDAARFEALAANALQAWRTEYVADDGTLTPDTQAAHVRALAFDLVPDELRATHGGAARRADPRRRHAPRHRLPRDAVPAARARRHRSPRRRVRAAPPGHRAVVAHDGGARRHHGVGGLGRDRRRRHAPRRR